MNYKEALEKSVQSLGQIENIKVFRFKRED